MGIGPAPIQVARRRSRPPPARALLEASTVIVVLLTVIRGKARRPEDVLTHLRAERRAATLAQIRDVFARRDLGLKHPDRSVLGALRRVVQRWEAQQRMPRLISAEVCATLSCGERGSAGTACVAGGCASVGGAGGTSAEINHADETDVL